ncbi:MAG: alginate lyase family protein [Halanaerobiales bacterium]
MNFKKKIESIENDYSGKDELILNVLNLLKNYVKNIKTEKNESDLVNMISDNIKEMIIRFQKENKRAVSGGIISLAGVILSHRENSYLWRLIGWSRLANFFDDNSKFEEELLLLTVKIALKKDLPILPELYDWYVNNTNEKYIPRAETYKLTDKDFFELMDFKIDGMSKVKKYYDENNLKQARKEYINFLKENKTLDNDCLLEPRNYSLEEADEICNNIFTLRAHMVHKHNYGPVIDWNTILMNDKESNVSINWHPHLRVLAKAYKETGKDKYINKLIQLWKSWYQQNPIPNIRRNIGPWRTLEAGSRSWRTWPAILNTFLGANVSPEIIFNFCKCYIEQAHYLLTHKAGGLNNWYQVESCGLATIAALFPEYKYSEYVYEIAVERITRINEICFLPDGFQYEGSATYHFFPYSGNAVFYRIAEEMNKKVPERFKKRFEKISDIFVYTAQPDLNLPMIQDTNPELTPAARGTDLALKILGKEEWKYISSDRKRGKPPAKTSCTFPHAGYYIMRESWQPDSQYLFFDSGYFGSNHQHEDKLNFILFGGGRILIGDPGIYQYKRDAFERYFRSSLGHNSIIIDGKEQCRARFGSHEEKPDPDSRWENEKEFLFAGGSYRDGFTEIGNHSREQDPEALERDLIHTRSIFHPRGGYYLIQDKITGNKNKKRRIDQIYHLAPIIQSPDPEGIRPVEFEKKNKTSILTTEKDYSNLYLKSVGLEKPDKLLDICGQKDPEVRGWFALYGKQPSPDINFVFEKNLPAYLYTFILPLPEGNNSIPVVNSYSLEQGKGLYIELKTDNTKDYLLISENGVQKMKSCNLEATAEVAWCRFNKNKLIKFGLVNGSKMQHEGKVIWKSENNRTYSKEI